MPAVVSGLKGLPHAGDVLRAAVSESRARAVAEARGARSQARHHARMEELSKDHFENVVDEHTGEAKQCASCTSCWLGFAAILVTDVHFMLQGSAAVCALVATCGRGWITGGAHHISAGFEHWAHSIQGDCCLCGTSKPEGHQDCCGRGGLCCLLWGHRTCDD